MSKGSAAYYSALLQLGVIEQSPSHHVIAVDLSCFGGKGVEKVQTAELKPNQIEGECICLLGKKLDEI